MQPGELFSIQEVKSLVTSALLAIFGGFAKMFTTQQRLSFYQLISLCIVSGFAGVMASYLVRQFPALPAEFHYRHVRLCRANRTEAFCRHL